MGRTGAGGVGRVGFDPATRRRVRRAGARARPLLLPGALLLSALVVASATGPPAPAGAAPSPLVVPEGLVLVAVHPADPAVLALAPPGSRVDVYASAGYAALDPLGTARPTGADLVVRDAAVVPPPGAGAVVADGGAGLSLAGPVAGAAAAASLALLVEPAEAAALAARPGGALLVAVLGQG